MKKITIPVLIILLAAGSTAAMVWQKKDPEKNEVTETAIIVDTITLFRGTGVYICNVIKCRPPGNRNPEPDEIETCLPFLERQIEAIRPDFICALGTFAAQTLLGTTTPISRLRGRFHEYRGIKVLPTYHPAYLLRNPEKKRDVWEDMKMLMKEYRYED